MVDTGLKHSLLFLCSENFEQAIFARLLFNAEAKRMELHWSAQAREISAMDAANQNCFSGVADTARHLSASTIEALNSLGLGAGIDLSTLELELKDSELENAELIVILAQAAEVSLFQQRCKAFSKKLEYWDIEAEEKLPASIQSEIKTLLVRLIMKSGKRPAIQTDICNHCGRSLSSCSCPSKKNDSMKKGEVIRVTLEKKGRGGKTVTTASGFSLATSALEELAGALKKNCGSGGTVKDGRIEIQGDKREQLIAELTSLGYRPKRSGS